MIQPSLEIGAHVWEPHAHHRLDVCGLDRDPLRLTVFLGFVEVSLLGFKSEECNAPCATFGLTGTALIGLQGQAVGGRLSKRVHQWM